MRRFLRSRRSLLLSFLIPGVLFVTAIIVAQTIPTRRAVRPLPLVKTTLVRGYIALPIPQLNNLFLAANVRSRTRDIYLPGLKVFLRAADGTKTAAGLTDLSGRFTLPARPGRRYQVCWESGSLGSGCTKQIYAVADTPAFLSKVLIYAKTAEKRPIVYGNVAFADGFSPRTREPMENVNSFACVELVDRGGKVLDKVYVNNFGEYVLPNVPGGEDIILRVKIEGSITDQRIRKEANLSGSAFQPIDLTISNSVPKLDPVVPLNGAGIPVKTALPGSPQTCRARGSDPGGDRLDYFWTIAKGSGAMSSTQGDSIQWTLPKDEGRYDITVIAWDHKGGYARDTLSVRVDRSGGVPFSGWVRGTDAPLLSDAEVEVNGERAIAAHGWFEMRVKDAPRFVLNIRRTGYGFYSKIYDDSVTAGTWTLTRATVATVDPRGDIVVPDERRPGNCPAPDTARPTRRPL